VAIGEFLLVVPGCGEDRRKGIGVVVMVLPVHGNTHVARGQHFSTENRHCRSFVDCRQRAAVSVDALSHQLAGFGNKFSSQSGSSEQTALSAKLIGSRNAELLQPCHLTSFQCGGEDEGEGLCL